MLFNKFCILVKEIIFYFYNNLMIDSAYLKDHKIKSKIKGVIDNSVLILEKKISIINKELQSLKNEYLEELVKCNKPLI
jgi:hypothetical protein